MGLISFLKRNLNGCEHKWELVEKLNGQSAIFDMVRYKYCCKYCGCWMHKDYIV